MTKFSQPKDLEQYRQTLQKQRDTKKTCISICSGTGCHAYASEKVVSAFEDQLKKQNLTNMVDMKRTGCHGFCEKGPIVVIHPHNYCYVKVKPDDVTEIITQTIQQGKPVNRLLYEDPETGKKIALETDIPFYKNQTRLIFGNNRKIDPKIIDDYIALDGYKALEKTLFKMTPQQVLDEVKKSNLRGRGGGGFPAGRKWETTKNASEEPKYVIVNCDEGDPGAYMDRSLMEGNPHSVLEGLIIGAYAIGAHEGFIYVRQEYPLAVENTEHAIKQAEEYGLLGKNILGSGFDFTIKIHRGAGAFVSGESSALMSAIEGRVGEPRPKYVHTAVNGLWNKPTCLNNVETWANVPFIINNGAQWFTSMGTPNSTGTKIFSLVGNVNNTGLVEVPMGITLREIIYNIGGGIPNGKCLKAVQTGGPSGGCIPEKYLDLTVDFDELYNVGSMMGSGGMIVMDEDTCMVDIARYFVNFLSDESCGKCIPCREGLRQMVRIMNDITAGRAMEEDIELLEELSEVVQAASLCALGQTAPNPILSTLKYFRDEYEAHVRGECPAKVCKGLIQFHIDSEKCKGCGLCLKNCPTDAISGQKKNIHKIDAEKCIKCGTCFDACKFSAVLKTSGGINNCPTEKVNAKR
jgi:NADH:ubiquinone oxidoreductase subunit F (NADH-binding)/(2Fe-2S) ferredoxin/NAD-dependent dihydropyrimidine dehydrogenase PreA subunit